MGEHFWFGMAIVFVSGSLVGSFALPIQYSRVWKWENTWLVFSVVALLVVPWLIGSAAIPNLSGVYQQVPTKVLVLSMTFGFLWGIAQVTLGLGISAIGMALAFPVVAGLSCLSGSLIPLLVLNPEDMFRPRGILLLTAIPILLLGLFLHAAAGRRREKEQSASMDSMGRPSGSFLKGLVICIFTGIFGSNINLGFAFSGEVQQRALDFGASSSTASFAVWVLILGAGFLPNAAYCVYFLFRNKTWPQFLHEPGREAILGAAMGLLWLFGILGYGIGATLTGKYGPSVGFTLFNASMILSSNSLGFLTGEWKGTAPNTRKLLWAALTVIVASVIVLNLGGLF